MSKSNDPEKENVLAQVERLPMTSRFVTDSLTDKCKISIMMIVNVEKYLYFYHYWIHIYILCTCTIVYMYNIVPIVLCSSIKAYGVLYLVHVHVHVHVCTIFRGVNLGKFRSFVPIDDSFLRECLNAWSTIDDMSKQLTKILSMNLIFNQFVKLLSLERFPLYGSQLTFFVSFPIRYMYIL